jgi:hypothetical protein
LVEKDAQKTEAHQTNRNILLTDEADVLSKPFLEIYADDVKCSHGSTVGQLDEEAMFYLRSRGICTTNARILLMHAFAGEVVDKINIEALSERTDVNGMDSLIYIHLTIDRQPGEIDGIVGNNTLSHAGTYTYQIAPVEGGVFYEWSMV